jgi:lysyl-tRNA synthetase class 2
MNGAPARDWQPSATLGTLRLRAQLLQAVRAYFAARGALEVETPILVRWAVTDLHLESLAVHGGNGARIGYLHTSPEYAMKRLLCAGAPDIYQVAHVFREGERGRRHNPEFTMIEWYRLGIDHHALMDDVELLLRSLLQPHRQYAAAQRVTYADAFARALALDPLACSIRDLQVALQARDVHVPGAVLEERDALLDLAMATAVAGEFPADRVTFVYDFPAAQAALAQVRGPVASRFEAFWGGLELANGFHELDDADEQARRFEADRAERRRRHQPDRETDARFISALTAGLPPCAGVALGFDRVVMIAAGVASIDEVLAFPVERA